MGLNRMMMKNGEVKVVDGSNFWGWNSADNKTDSFTVPPGVKRIKVYATMDWDSETAYSASIKNTNNGKIWGSGYSNHNNRVNIDSIVGVTPNKTYNLLFNCGNTSGVTFSWGKEINAMTPTVEDY